MFKYEEYILDCIQSAIEYHRVILVYPIMIELLFCKPKIKYIIVVHQSLLVFYGHAGNLLDSPDLKSF